MREESFIRLRGVRQHNLKNIDLDLPLGKLIAVSGVSGSGKSSLALHTLYAEGQRRYVETFSPYARQFLERMDPPNADSIDGIPPSIAIESGTAVRSSRSTVGTITEINDYLKLLYARLAVPHCPTCGKPVHRDTPESIYRRLDVLPAGSRVLVCFPFAAGRDEDPRSRLVSQGFLRLYAEGGTVDLDSPEAFRVYSTNSEIQVVVDRISWGKASAERINDSLSTAFRAGEGRVTVVALPETVMRFSADLNCPDCETSVPIPPPTPSLFSFNSPLGACSECRGFGRTIGVDPDLVVPNKKLSLMEGALKPFNKERNEFQDLMDFCRGEGIPVDVPYESLSEDAKARIFHGTKTFYGVEGLFEWLETKTYKMHVRVFLSRYRAYTTCKACGGARFQPSALLYRLKGVDIGTLGSWSIERLDEFFGASWPELDVDPAAELLVDEIRSRLHFLRAVGLDYLSLDRQSRTLSGGEVQRVHLTRALGSSMVNVLYVLDEPSVGLHARDQKRLMDQLTCLVEMGNSVVVVEHDPDMIRLCEEVVDMGPGGGEKGGAVVYAGPPEGLANCPESLTGRYLGKRVALDRDGGKRRTPDPARRLVIKGARENNLKNIDVPIPLGLLVGICGVSGSGKSTLVEKTLYYSWLRQVGKPTETPGLSDGLEGADLIDEIVMVDQQPIGRTPRANLLTYTRALDPLRKLLAQTPEAASRGYGARHFSFNIAGGRCELCSGEGFERVEMQFLADVFIRCPRCDGKRFKDEILDIKSRGLSIGDMLECTAQELLESFGDRDAVVKALDPIVAIGLDYLRVGQPLSSLSGGEAQRLKLAHFLGSGNGSSSRANGPRPGRRLFLLDEPTTGLHPHDMHKLVDVLRRLTETGNTVLVVEHNIDLLLACDWLIDLGPEGGERGGGIVVSGTPEDVAECGESETGRFLRLGMKGSDLGAPARSAVRKEGDNGACRDIVVRGARAHNLKLDEVHIPRNEMTVLTGLSGSGKSTLAFDVLFAEGQRRYLECLSTYVRQYFKILEKPDVDQILGLPPTIAIEQRTSRLNRRSTVATITEIYHFLRLLYSKLGRQRCPDCGEELTPLTFDRILTMARRDLAGGAKLLAPLVHARKGIYKDLFARLKKMGFETVRVDGVWMPLDPIPSIARSREHNIDALIPGLDRPGILEAEVADKVKRALSLGAGTLYVEGPESKVYSEKLYCAGCERGLAPLDPRLFSFNSRYGACPKCGGLGTIKRVSVERLCGAADPPLKDGLIKFVQSSAWRGELKKAGRRIERYWRDTLRIDPRLSFGDLDDKTREEMLYGKKGRYLGLVRALEQVSDEGRERAGIDRLFDEAQCPECRGSRLNRQARSVSFRNYLLGDLVRLSVSEFEREWNGFRFEEHETPIVGPISKEIRERLTFLREVGLDYLALDRSGDTLSGGEAQRIRLAAQLGSNLRGVLYVLDEPTIGLHATDNERLLKGLKRLKERGNTIVVVEHDAETMRRADSLIELGPGAGRAGGELVAQAGFDRLCKDKNTLTGQWFGKAFQQLLNGAGKKKPGEEGYLEVKGAGARNLKDVDVKIPLGTLTTVTGVSGAGKSTLAHEVIYLGLMDRLGRGAGKINAPVLKDMKGFENITRVLEVDHNPIGRTPRSIPATYVGIWDEVRKIFAALPEARARGFTPGRFSFNVKGGRCEECKGQGRVRVEMNFLPDVFVPCDSCGDSRFNGETLAVRYKGHNIADVLAMTIEEAARLFDAFTKVSRPLKALTDLGLGYLTLGQSSPTLSGGEAQRIKLASELGSSGSPTLYLLDEPTTGLHRADVKRLIDVLRALTAHGHTALVIEHNLDFIWASDYVVDIGPGSGDAGGRIVVEGTPSEILNERERSATAAALFAHVKSFGGGRRPRK